MKTIIVTGGNRGIGLEICRQLDVLGHRVILCSRDIEKGNEATKLFSKNIIVKQLDVTNENSIQNLFEFVKNDIGKLDVLINNAGVGANHFLQKKSFLFNVKHILESNIYGIRRVNEVLIPFLKKNSLVSKKENASNISLENVKQLMETNFYGVWRMIQVFITLLQKTENSRIINISSGMGELNSLTGEYAGYSLSKASLNSLTIMFSNELKDKGVKVNAMCPGWVKTDMGGPNAPKTVSEGADTAVWLATENEIPTGKFFKERKEIDW